MRRKLQVAYELPTYEQAKGALLKIRSELKVLNLSAVASLDDGVEETLTLHPSQARRGGPRCHRHPARFRRKGDSRLLEAVLQLRMRTRPMQRASSARTDLRARAAPIGLGRHDDRLPAGHQEGGRSGQTDQGPFDESSDPRLRGPLSEHPGRRLCRQSLIRIACPCRKETRAAEKDQAQELTRTAGSAPPGSPGFHVRLQRPLRQ